MAEVTKGDVRSSTTSLGKAEKCKATSEQPKVAVRKSLGLALVECLVHVPSIAITVGVVSVTFRSAFWRAPGPDTSFILSALQFAAKVHESLITLSICTMVMYHIRRALIGSQGVPLGLVSAGLQLNSISYLLSWEFWGSMSGTHFWSSKSVLLMAGILTAFVFAALASPSSAITMIPRLDWWGVNELWPGNRLVFNAFVQAPHGVLYPETLTKDLLPVFCYSPGAASQRECPSGGLSSILAAAQTGNNSFGFNGPQDGNPTFNLSLPVANNTVFRFLGGSGSSGDLAPMSTSYFPTSGVSAFLASALWNYYSLVSSWEVVKNQDSSSLMKMSQTRGTVRSTNGRDSARPQMPAVQVECEPFDSDSSSIIFPHSSFNYTPWANADFTNAVWSVPTANVSNLVIDPASDNVDFTWVDLGLSIKPMPSIVGLFALPGPDLDPSVLWSSLYACTVAANWVPSTPWIEPSIDTFVHDKLPEPFDTTSMGIDSGVPSAYPPVFVDIGWAEALNVQYQAGKSNQTTMQALGSICINATEYASDANGGTSNQQSIGDCLATGLALFVADGLARAQSTYPTYFAVTGPAQMDYQANIRGAGSNPDLLIHTQWISALDLGFSINLYPEMTLAILRNSSKYTELHFEVMQYGYGYGFKGPFIYIAVIILIVHVIAALIHIGVVLRDGTSSSVWSSSGEMLALAINSEREPKLRNTGAGIMSKQTWALMAKVRECDDQGLEIVFDDGGKNGRSDRVCGRIVPGRKY